jgi:hypothetical protein
MRLPERQAPYRLIVIPTVHADRGFRNQDPIIDSVDRRARHPTTHEIVEHKAYASLYENAARAHAIQDAVARRIRAREVEKETS